MVQQSILVLFILRLFVTRRTSRDRYRDGYRDGNGLQPRARNVVNRKHVKCYKQATIQNTNV